MDVIFDIVLLELNCEGRTVDVMVGMVCWISLSEGRMVDLIVVMVYWS